MSKRLEGKVAIVTGSGQGIGKAIAIALAKEGARVVTNNRRPGSTGGDAGTVVKEIEAMGGEGMPFFGSISDFDDAEVIVKLAMEKFGRLDILVNNAGADAPRMVWNMSEEEWDRCVDSFLKGSFNCTRFATPLMREQKWGRIINTTSTAWLGTVGHCNYGAAKAGIVGLTRAVAREVGRYGVTCNAYAPTAATRFTLSDDIVAGFKKRYEAGLMTKKRYEELTNPPKPETVGHCNYGAAKAGIVGLTRAVAREVGRYGVTCNAYAPTAATRFTLSDDIVAGFKKRFEAGLMTKKRFEELTNPPKPETVGPFIVYLCTDEAADINGQVFDVTGGDIAIYSEPVKKKSIVKETGMWTVEELIEQVPKVLLEGYKNPAPPQPDK
jgi:NAD(P)-dependent dehydrogenase (short-subunit alcohol dehydrogenase family)